MLPSSSRFHHLQQQKSEDNTPKHAVDEASSDSSDGSSTSGSSSSSDSDTDSELSDIEVPAPLNTKSSTKKREIEQKSTMIVDPNISIPTNDGGHGVAAIFAAVDSFALHSQCQSRNEAPTTEAANVSAAIPIAAYGSSDESSDDEDSDSEVEELAVQPKATETAVEAEEEDDSLPLRTRNEVPVRKLSLFVPGCVHISSD